MKTCKIVFTIIVISNQVFTELVKIISLSLKGSGGTKSPFNYNENISPLYSEDDLVVMKLNRDKT